MVKGKRWKKGQSSSSNPESKKHRELSKTNRIFNFGLGSVEEKSSALTAKALAELENASINQERILEENDTKSVCSDSADTFRSWASNWSDCTNATFNKVHRYWRSNSALHKEILAVLAAITEIIKQNDGKETEIEYFAALMTGLDSVKENEETTAAFLYLIALAIKKVPENVLRAKYGQLLESLIAPMAEYSEKANNVTLIKSGLMCLCWLLKSQDKQAWQIDHTQNSFMLILSFIDHEKPKIRKCGQEAVRLILNSSNSFNDDISAFTAEFCLDLILNGNKLKKKIDEQNEKNNKQSNNSTILHTLSFIKQIVYHFQFNTLKSISECLLRLMSLKDILITSLCFQTFHELFESQTNNLNADLNGQIINALYDYQPSENDPQQLIGWLVVMETALKSLNRLSKPLCYSHMANFFQAQMLALGTSHHQNVQMQTVNCMCSVLEQCVQTNINDLSSTSNNNTLIKVFSHIETGLSYQYLSVWKLIMKVLACAFTCFKSRDTFSIVRNCIASLGNLRESEQFTYKKEADVAIGHAIQTYGPQLILTAIPLNMNANEDDNIDYPRSWMLPLLKSYTERTELAFFVDKLLPLATKFKEKSIKCNNVIEAKVFENIQQQIWSILPGFCNYATDFEDSFKRVAKTLGEILEKRADVRTYVLHALRTATHRNTDDGRTFLSKYAKNFLPILFNIYTTDVSLLPSKEKDKEQGTAVRQSILDTIKCFLQIADLTLVNVYLLQAVKNYENYSTTQQTKNMKQTPVLFDFNSNKKNKDTTDISGRLLDAQLFAKHGFLDLIAVFVKYSNESNLEIIYELTLKGIQDQLDNQDKIVQKKCYKILDAMLSCGGINNQTIRLFVEKKFENIATVFSQSLAKCSASAKVPRLKCLIHLMNYLNKVEQKIFVRQMLPEVILCIKEINHKSREAAFTLLTTMLTMWQKLDSNKTELDSLYEFFHLVMIGLAGSINMIACSCLALSSLTFEFRENISGPIIGELIETACLLSRHEHREVILASLNLLKCLCQVLPQATLAQHLNSICSGVIHGLHEKRVSSQNTQTFENVAPVTKSQQIRNYVKLILKKLMKKFSYEILLEKVFSKENEKVEMECTGSKQSSLTAVVKQGLENLLINLKKSIEKDKQRKAEEQKQQGKNAVEKNDDLISVYTTKTKRNEEVEELLKESDSDDDEETKTNKEVNKKKGKKKKEKNDISAWLQENEDEDPLDLLDPMAIKRVLATKPLTKNQLEAKKAKETSNRSKNRGFKTTGDGKLLIEDDDDQDDDLDKKSNKQKKKKKEKDDLDEMMDTLSLSKKSTKSKQRIIGADVDSDEDILEETKSYKTGGTGIHRKLTINSKKESIDYGSEYRSKKAKGDVKRKDKPDPYAYIPFNLSKLNRRKRAKLNGEFKGIVKAVKKGASKANKTTKRLNK